VISPRISSYLKVIADLLHRLDALERVYLDSEFPRVLFHKLSELGPGDVFKPGVVLDRFGVEQLSTDKPLFNDDGLQI
jgi:hypothetical protein